MGLIRNCIFFGLQQSVDSSVPAGSSPQQPVMKADQVRQFFTLLSDCIDVIKIWAHKIPGFTSELCREDQELLFQSACLELLVLRLAYR